MKTSILTNGRICGQVVYSPMDHGYYCETWDRRGRDHWVSSVFKTKSQATKTLKLFLRKGIKTKTKEEE